MADNVPINTGTAVTIAAEDVGGTEYQRIKIVDGGAAGVTGVVATSGVPAAGTVGLVVAPKQATVNVSGAVQVSGTVTIAPTTLTVNTAATVSGANVTVAGTVTITPTTLTVNTAATVSGANVTVAGTVTITPTTLTVNTAATIAGASVTIQQGASVSVGNLNTVDVTTATGANIAAASTGLIVAIKGQFQTIVIQESARNMFVLMVSSTVASNANMLLFTVYTGLAGQAPVTAGVSLFAIPTNQKLRILSLQAVAAGSASALIGQVQIVFATSAATVTVSAIGGRGPGLAVAAGTTVYSQFQADANCDITGTNTVGIGVTANTSCLIGGVMIAGYFFV